MYLRDRTVNNGKSFYQRVFFIKPDIKVVLLDKQGCQI